MYLRGYAVHKYTYKYEEKNTTKSEILQKAYGFVLWKFFWVILLVSVGTVPLTDLSFNWFVLSE